MRRPSRRAAAALAAVLFAGAALAAALPSSPPPITFVDVTKRAGVKFKFETDLRRGRMVATMGGAVAMGDYDGDGFPDLFFTGSVANAKHPEAGPCGALFRNRGDGTFEDTTQRAGIHACGWSMGAHWVDVDSTGRLDLLVTGLGITSLYKNQGDGTFNEVSAARGLVSNRFGVGLAAGDVNGDGRVDLYVVNYVDTDVERELSLPQFQVRLPEDYPGQDGCLFVQREDGRFEDRAEASGATNRGGRGLGAVFFDYDGDGKTDLFITNDRQTNRLYHGKGDGTFEDVTLETGAGSRDQMIPRAGMGIAVGDVDGDGNPDILVTNFAGEPITLYRNLEGALFEDASEWSGIAKSSLPYVQWGTDLVDLDNDGWLDALAVSGHLIPRWIMIISGLTRSDAVAFYARGDRSYKQPPVVWRNLGGGRLFDVTSSSRDLSKLRLAARGLAIGDLDGDGRMDLAIASVSGGVHVLRNTTERTGHVLEILPVATGGRTALGTKLIVTSGGRRQVSEFILRPSYASGSWLPVHFGLGESTSADKVEVIPPGGTAVAYTFENVPAGRLYELRGGQLAQRREFKKN